MSQNKRLILGFLPHDTVWCPLVAHSGPVVTLFFTVPFIIWLVQILIWRAGFCFVLFRLEMLLLVSLVCMLLTGILLEIIFLINWLMLLIYLFLPLFAETLTPF